MQLIVTCEHGGNRVPAEYRHLFDGWERVLASHAGHDPGALDLARDMAKAFDAPLVSSTTSRLLIELNRSPGHPKRWSERTRDLPQADKERILARYYLPYRRAVRGHIDAVLRSGQRVLHVSSHSFTPVLDGVVRQTDIGVLYDPQRAPERALAERWAALLRQHVAPLRVRRNYPYRGISDGLTTFLRRSLAPELYSGIELEVNQKHTLGEAGAWRRLRASVVAAVRDLLAEQGGS